ncbi:hypothetical protein AKJ16_DCAP11476 [Drosera capensis]
MKLIQAERMTKNSRQNLRSGTKLQCDPSKPERDYVAPVELSSGSATRSRTSFVPPAIALLF